MAYTGDNQRVQKDSSGGTTKFIWDGQNYLAEADGTNTIQTVYTDEPQQYGNLISSRLPIAGTPTSFYHHFDALGSTRQLTNAAGTVTDTVVYDAWGNVVNRTGTAPIVFLWVAVVEYYFDVETGQVYIRERIYGPTIGRWTAVDPLWIVISEAAYIYASNRANYVIDPSGLDVDSTNFPSSIDDDKPTTPTPPPKGSFTIESDVTCCRPDGKKTVIGTLYASRLFYHRSKTRVEHAVKANGIGYYISFIKNAAGDPGVKPCCCDDFEFIQVLNTNWALAPHTNGYYVDSSQVDPPPTYGGIVKGAYKGR